jgi:hypothetical protein
VSSSPVGEDEDLEVWSWAASGKSRRKEQINIETRQFFTAAPYPD